MSVEQDYQSLYKKFKRLPVNEIEEKIEDIRNTTNNIGVRIGSEGFIVLNDSTNNLKYAVLVQILEEKRGKKV